MQTTAELPTSAAILIRCFIVLSPFAKLLDADDGASGPVAGLALEPALGIAERHTFSTGCNDTIDDIRRADARRGVSPVVRSDRGAEYGGQRRWLGFERG